MTRQLSAVVELVGLPGSGKTTLATALRHRLVGAGIPCTVLDAGISAKAPKRARIARRTGYALHELAHAPGSTRRVTRVLVSSGQEGPRDTAAVLAQWLAIEHLAGRDRGRPGVRLLEEGVVQTSWTAVLRAKHVRAEDLWACMTPGARSDLALFLDVPPELAADRLAERRSRHSRTQRLDAAARLDELRRGQAILDEILVSCPLRVSRLQGSASVAKLADLAYAAVLRLARGDAPLCGPDLR